MLGDHELKPLAILLKKPIVVVTSQTLSYKIVQIYLPDGKPITSYLSKDIIFVNEINHYHFQAFSPTLLLTPISPLKAGKTLMGTSTEGNYTNLGTNDCLLASIQKRDSSNPLFKSSRNEIRKQIAKYQEDHWDDAFYSPDRNFTGTFKSYSSNKFPPNTITEEIRFVYNENKEYHIQGFYNKTHFEGLLEIATSAGVYSVLYQKKSIISAQKIRTRNSNGSLIVIEDPTDIAPGDIDLTEIEAAINASTTKPLPPDPDADAAAAKPPPPDVSVAEAIQLQATQMLSKDFEYPISFNGTGKDITMTVPFKNKATYTQMKDNWFPNGTFFATDIEYEMTHSGEKYKLTLTCTKNDTNNSLIFKLVGALDTGNIEENTLNGFQTFFTNLNWAVLDKTNPLHKKLQKEQIPLISNFLKEAQVYTRLERSKESTAREGGIDISDVYTALTYACKDLDKVHVLTGCDGGGLNGVPQLDDPEIIYEIIKFRKLGKTHFVFPRGTAGHQYAVVIDFDTNTIHYSDSMQNSPRHAPGDTGLKPIQQLLKQKTKIDFKLDAGTRITCTPQTKTWSCGFHVAKNVALILEKIGITNLKNPSALKTLSEFVDGEFPKRFLKIFLMCDLDQNVDKKRQAARDVYQKKKTLLDEIENARALNNDWPDTDNLGLKAVADALRQTFDCIDRGDPSDLENLCKTKEDSQARIREEIYQPLDEYLRGKNLPELYKINAIKNNAEKIVNPDIPTITKENVIANAMNNETLATEKLHYFQQNFKTAKDKLDDAIQIENQHDWVQILFPTAQKSRFAHQKFYLSDTEDGKNVEPNTIQKFKSHKIGTTFFQDDLFEDSLPKLLAHWGLKLDTTTGDVTIQNQSRFNEYITATPPKSHNCDRATRVLECLRLFSDMTPIGKKIALARQTLGTLLITQSLTNNIPISNTIWTSEMTLP